MAAEGRLGVVEHEAAPGVRAPAHDQHAQAVGQLGEDLAELVLERLAVLDECERDRRVGVVVPVVARERRAARRAEVGTRLVLVAAPPASHPARVPTAARRLQRPSRCGDPSGVLSPRRALGRPRRPAARRARRGRSSRPRRSSPRRTGPGSAARASSSSAAFTSTIVPRDRRVDLRHRLRRLDLGAARVAATTAQPDVGELHVDDVAERVLGVVGDADARPRRRRPRPTRAPRCTAAVRELHRLLPPVRPCRLPADVAARCRAEVLLSARILADARGRTPGRAGVPRGRCRPRPTRGSAAPRGRAARAPSRRSRRPSRRR